MTSNNDAGNDIQAQELVQSRKLIYEFLSQRSKTFLKLSNIRQKLWDDPVHDAHYQEQQNRSDNADGEQQQWFYNMMLTIGRTMDFYSGVFSLDSEQPLVLDACFAPGGFARVLLDNNPNVKICGLTLSEEEGGHPVLLTNEQQIQLRFIDVNKLGSEYGLRPKEVLEEMSTDIVYAGKQFDLAICDGQLLRTNKIHRDPKLEDGAAARLRCSQLILAMNRLRNGGTILVLLHHIEAQDNIELLHLFSHMAEIQLFKHRWFHAPRSSFYLIARNVQSDSFVAATAIQNWKEIWRKCTFESAMVTEEISEAGIAEAIAVKNLLKDFGETFIKLAEPIWLRQITGLEDRAKKLETKASRKTEVEVGEASRHSAGSSKQICHDQAANL